MRREPLTGRNYLGRFLDGSCPPGIMAQLRHLLCQELVKVYEWLGNLIDSIPGTCIYCRRPMKKNGNINLGCSWWFCEECHPENQDEDEEYD